MKVGLSLSRCIRDIHEGKIDIGDVLIIIARTDFDPEDDQQWSGIWEGYGGGQTLGNPWSNPEWNGILAEDEQRVRDICIELKKSGRLHQPRQFGARPSRRPEVWLETVLPNDELKKNSVAKAAWDKFQTVAGLTNVSLDRTYK